MNFFGGYEPKKENRFILKFPEEFEIPYWVVSATERPKFTTNGYHLIPEQLKIILNDPIGPSTTSKIWEILVGLTDIEPGEQITPELKVELQTKFQKFNSGFDYTLNMLDPVGQTVEKWVIKNAKLVKIDFGPLDYGNSDGVCTVTLSVQPEKATLIF